MSSESQTQCLKRPSNAYIHFSNANRDKVKEANKELSHKEIIKKLSTLWNQHKERKSNVYVNYTKMAEDEKTKYKSLVKEDPSLVRQNKPKKSSTTVKKTKAEAVQPAEPAQPAEPVVEKVVKSKKATVKSPTAVLEEEVAVVEDKPKKTTAWSLFQKVARVEVKEEQPELSGKEVSAEVSRRWKALSDEEKNGWLQA